jgi:hypothetical protein
MTAAARTDDLLKTLRRRLRDEQAVFAALPSTAWATASLIRPPGASTRPT